MKNFYSFLVIALFNLLIHTAYAQYPFVIECIADVDLHIRVSPDWGAGYFDDISDGQRLVAIDEDGDEDGWYQVCVMDPYGYKFGYVNKGYYEGDYLYFDALCSANYVEIVGAPSGLVIREYAGAGFDDVVWMDGEWAACWNGQLFATTGDEEVIGGVTWFEIYLTDDCSQMTGWVSGTYCDEFTSGDCDFPDMPDDFEIDDVSETTMHLDWVSGGGDVDFYNIYYCGAFSPFATTTSTSFTVTGLIPGVEYSFFITAVSGFGVSDPTDCLTGTTDGESPDMPGGFVLTDITATSMKADWSPAEGADHYEVYNCMTGVIVGTTESTYMNFTGLLPGNMYGYKVRSVTDDGAVSPWTTCLYAWTEDADIPGVPVGLVFSDITTTTATLDWDAPAGGATGYEIFDCYSGEIIAYTTASNYTKTGLSPSTYIGYAVRSVSGGYYSVFTACIWGMTDAVAGPGVPTGLVVTDATETSITINWDAPVGGADNYQVKNCVTGIIVSSPIASFALISGLSEGTSYQFAVRTVLDGSYSAWTTCIYATTDAAPGAPGTPVAFEIDGITETTIIYDWAAPASGADYYQFKNCSTGVIIASPAATAYSVTGLLPGESFSGQVRTVKDGLFSAWTICLAGTTTIEVPETTVDFISFTSNTEGVYPYDGLIPLVSADGGEDFDDLEPVKICADGSNATMVTVTISDAAVASNIRLRMASDPYGYESELSGWFIEGDYTVAGATISARYTHPKYFEEEEIFRTDILQVVDNVSEIILYEYPVEIYHEPVVFVHGYMGSGEAFNETKDYLDGYVFPSDGHLTEVIDYTLESYDAITDNFEIVPNAVHATIWEARNHSYSCGKATVIAHSMGGLLLRTYLQSGDYREDINKVVTIGTPHAGSPVADFALSSDLESIATFISHGYVVSAAAILAIKEILLLYGFDGDAPAVYDLQTDTYIIDEYLNNLTLDENVVPTHVITFDILPELDGWFLDFAFLGLDEAINEVVFMDIDHDGVVQVTSQNAGVNDLATTEGAGEFHIGEGESDLAKLIIRNAIMSSPDAIMFTHDGFGPVPDIESYFPGLKISDSMSVDSISESDLQLIKPSVTSSFEEEGSLIIEYNTAVNVDSVSIFIGSPKTGFLQRVMFHEAHYVYTTSIPADVQNELIVFATSFDSGLITDFDVIKCPVYINSTLVGIEVVDEIVSVQSALQYIPVYGVYSSGEKRELTDWNSMGLATDNSSVLDVLDSISGFKGIVPGNANYIVGYGGYVDSVSVNILPIDSSVFTSIYPIDTNQNSYVFEPIEIFLTPNPTAQYFRILFSSALPDSFYEIEVYDVFGQRHAQKKIVSFENGVSGVFSTNGDSPGLYIVALFENGNLLSYCKLVVTY